MSHKPQKSHFRKIVKYVLLGYVALTLLIVAVLVWVYFSYLSGPGSFNVNEYHPFRSEEAKVEFLEYYDAESEKWLDELFTALELDDSINLVGASYGGWKAGQYLKAHPERINKVVLLSPAYTVYHGNKEFEKRVFRGFIPLRHFMKKELYWSCEDMAQTEEGRALLDDHLDGLRLAIKSFKIKIPASMTVLSDEELRSIKSPVLYLVGENEKMHNAREAVKRLNSISPVFETEVVPNTGHCLMFCCPDLVNAKILDFLAN